LHFDKRTLNALKALVIENDRWLGADKTPTGKLMLTVLGGVAQFEREMMIERQREGLNQWLNRTLRSIVPKTPPSSLRCEKMRTKF
jgi:DNA invertase Pin-like site-specific DNA recombinase